MAPACYVGKQASVTLRDGPSLRVGIIAWLAFSGDLARPSPRLFPVRQRLYSRPVPDLDEAVRDAVRAAVAGRDLRGHRVAITAGSRGIQNIAPILRAAVENVRALGGEPFVAPAMGSHGGATAEGQL